MTSPPSGEQHEAHGDGGPERHETHTERMDRNWDELLQELRVTQTGVQLQAGFLLTLPFQARFTSITDTQRGIYLVCFGLTLLAVVCLVAPVSAHRLLFRHHEKKALVGLANVAAKLGLLFLGLSLATVVLLIVDVVVGRTTAVAASGAMLAVLLALWLTPAVLTGRSHGPSRR